MNFRNIILSVLSVCFFCISAGATQWYVIQETGSDSNSGLSEKEAFRTLQKAADMVEPGDIVYIGNGVYTSADARGEAVLEIHRSGTPDAWITWTALKGHTHQIRPSGWSGILILADYQVLDGLTVIGNNDSIALKHAIADLKNTTPNPYFNTNGIFVDGRKKPVGEKPHHTVIRNCTVCKCAGGGITGIEMDYFTVENCKVYNNAWYMRYAGSGITTLNNWAFDYEPGYHVIIRNNLVWNNRCMVSWEKIGKLSDGNGILLDVTNPRTPNLTNPEGDAVVQTEKKEKKPVVNPDNPTRPEWPNRALIENNVSVYNGGSGIHVFRTSHVDIINNTTYWNGSSVDYEELFPNTSTDIVIKNNIMVPRPGGRVTSNNRNSDIVWDGNVYPVDQNVIRGENDIVAMPEFVDPYIDLEKADFRLRKGSALKGKGADLSKIKKIK
ncbi:MAG: right-handed parallel beta-helix repeat-containing protein [Bacteroidales bacterium]|nr:right-handed parallel beta-helix repeat-containing protein [Bacteroidales bacterium]